MIFNLLLPEKSPDLYKKVFFVFSCIEICKSEPVLDFTSTFENPDFNNSYFIWSVSKITESFCESESEVEEIIFANACPAAPEKEMSIIPSEFSVIVTSVVQLQKLNIKNALKINKKNFFIIIILFVEII